MGTFFVYHIDDVGFSIFPLSYLDGAAKINDCFGFSNMSHKFMMFLKLYKFFRILLRMQGSGERRGYLSKHVPHSIGFFVLNPILSDLAMLCKLGL